MEAVKSMDRKYRVSETTMTAASYTGRTVVAAANAVVNNSYFAKGAFWVSDVLTRAASVAADLGSHGVKNTRRRNPFAAFITLELLYHKGGGLVGSRRYICPVVIVTSGSL
ncbi:hypothetical protein ACSBR2_023203 [Camellia fascicularis]